MISWLALFRHDSRIVRDSVSLFEGDALLHQHYLILYELFKCLSDVKKWKGGPFTTQLNLDFISIRRRSGRSSCTITNARERNFSHFYFFLVDPVSITYIELQKFFSLKISKDSPFLSLIFLPDNKKMSGHLLQKEMNKIFKTFYGWYSIICEIKSSQISPK